MYSTTSKVLDKRLSREEQLVYLKCFVPKSLADLTRLTGLETGVLERTLQSLLASGLLRQLSNNLAHNPKATMTSESLQEAPLEKAKRSLGAELERLLGSQAEALKGDIQTARSVAELKGTVRKILLKLKLTMSQKVAREFEATVQAVLGNTP